MIGVDTQLLVYAMRADSPFHTAALSQLHQLAESGRSWAIPWPCVHEFISTVTRRLYRPPSTLDQALAAIEAWAQSPGLVFLPEGPAHLGRLRELAMGARAMGPRIHDARIAAICLEAGMTEFWTADRDFARFGELKCRNPLVG